MKDSVPSGWSVKWSNDNSKIRVNEPTRMAEQWKSSDWEVDKTILLKEAVVVRCESDDKQIATSWCRKSEDHILPVGQQGYVETDIPTYIVDSKLIDNGQCRYM